MKFVTNNWENCKPVEQENHLETRIFFQMQAQYLLSTSNNAFLH